jgi:hypothetical protein
VEKIKQVKETDAEEKHRKEEMSAVRKRMDFEFKKLLDERHTDVDIEDAKVLQ